MPRPISWLPRLHEIRRSLATSLRSHYGRQDLEQLFQLQPRAAQKLIEILPSVEVGTSRLVEREALSRFLEGANETEDVSAYLEQVRRERNSGTRKKIRSLVRADLAPVSLDALPDNLAVSPGRLEVTFRTVEELAEAMYVLARVLQCDGDQFARLYEPRAASTDSPAAADVRRLFGELEELEGRVAP